MQDSFRNAWGAGLAVGALLAAVAAMGPAQAQVGSSITYEELAFDVADTDDDSLINEAEFVRDAAAGFSGLDANRDGKLTPGELEAHDPAEFRRVDANGDGALSFSEVMTFKMKAFEAADKNKDDALSFEEMLGAVKAQGE